MDNPHSPQHHENEGGGYCQGLHPMQLSHELSRRLHHVTQPNPAEAGPRAGSPADLNQNRIMTKCRIACCNDER